MSAEQVPTTINWIQLVFPAVGVSAVVGGVVSALVNYWMNIRASRKKSEMSLIEKKIQLYAFLISRLDEMKYIDDAIALHQGKPQDPNGFSYPDRDWERIMGEIDNKIQETYFLLKRPIYKKWVAARTLRAYPVAKEVLPELRQMLTDEYNQVLKKHFKHIKGDIISEISPDESVLDFTQPKSNNDRQQQSSNPS
jgi:hypothetical protein